MKKAILLLAVLMIFAVPMALAAQGVPATVDPKIIEAILKLSFIPGGALTILGLTEVVKRLIWKDEATRPKWAGYVVSIALSIVATAAYFTLVVHPFVFGTFALYAVFVALGANGIYKTL